MKPDKYRAMFGRYHHLTHTLHVTTGPKKGRWVFAERLPMSVRRWRR